MLFSKQKMRHQNNWAKIVSFAPRNYHFPHNVDELAQIVKDAHANRRCVRVIGSGHSFTPVASCDDIMVSLDLMQGVIQANKEDKQVTLWGGTKLSRIGKMLWQHGLALPNMGDIDKQAIAGALQTGTHGTGAALKCLSAYIVELSLMLPHGEVVVCNRNKHRDLFVMARLGLGTLGIVVNVTIQCIDSYILEDKRWGMDLTNAFYESEALARSHRHYEFFWFPFTETIAAKTLNVVHGKKPRSPLGAYVNDHVMENGFYQALCSIAYRQTWLTKPVNRLSAAFVPTGQYADDSFKVFPSARNVVFSEMEFAVPTKHGPACLHHIKNLIEKNNLRIFLPIEYRYVAADDIPLSPFFERDCVTISLHSYKGLDQTPYFNGAQAIFLKFGGRPHWGKLHSVHGKQVGALYSAIESFRKLRREIDPHEMFLTPYLRSLLISDA